MTIITTADGTPTFTLVGDGAQLTTPGMIPGTTAAGAVPGITADGMIPGSMVTVDITDGTVHGTTDWAVTMVVVTMVVDITAAVIMAAVTPTGSTTAITAVSNKTVQVEVQVFTDEVLQTEHPLPQQVCPAGHRV